MFLWLDDCRQAPEGWTHAKTYDEAIKHLQSGQVEHCSLDHDLGETDPSGKTGYDVVQWMAENNTWPKFKPMVHSMNPSGSARMRLLIEKAFPEASS